MSAVSNHSVGSTSPAPLQRHQSVVMLGTEVAMEVVEGDILALESLSKPEDAEEVKANLNGFLGLFNSFLVNRKVGNTVEWDKIQPLPPTAVRSYASINPAPAISNESARALLDKLVVLKLNGGLGTSMGCVGPKSLISVRNDATFLDLTVKQIEGMNKKYGSNVPLLLMNSFNTHLDTERIRHKYDNRVNLHMFQQSCYPRVLKETLRPYPTSLNSESKHWYPPGHGDVYTSLKRSKLLDKLLKSGKEYIFISNIDNLGATVDLAILNFLINPPNPESPCEFVMEVTDKTRSDVKGGTLVQYENKLNLLEIAQVPKDKVDEFKSISKFKVFNTNNLWANMRAIDRLLSRREMEMDVIVNRKTLDDGTNVIQLETAAGSAIKNFQGAIGINVPRSRFLPVKKTSDLLVVMSDLFTLQNGSIIKNPRRSVPGLPLVKLGDAHFGKVKDFLERFDNVPQLLELDHLTVSGDVTFGKDVKLRGTVIIIANHGDRIDIPQGACLENKIVSGNLRILDH